MAKPLPHINYTEPVLKEQKNTQTKVVSGQAPSLQSLVYKMQNGIPVQASSRTLETYYRNLDLVDVQNIGERYKEQAQKVLDAQQEIITKRKQLKEENDKAFEAFKKQFYEQRNEQSDSTNSGS